MTSAMESACVAFIEVCISLFMFCGSYIFGANSNAAFGHFPKIEF